MELVERHGKKHDEILDKVLNLHPAQPSATRSEMKPIGRGRNFNSVRADYERQKREEHWTKKIEEIEAKDMDAKIDEVK